jgi:hypothetical protein
LYIRDVAKCEAILEDIGSKELATLGALFRVRRGSSQQICDDLKKILRQQAVVKAVAATARDDAIRDATEDVKAELEKLGRDFAELQGALGGLQRTSAYTAGALPDVKAMQATAAELRQAREALEPEVAARLRELRDLGREREDVARSAAQPTALTTAIQTLAYW